MFLRTTSYRCSCLICRPVQVNEWDIFTRKSLPIVMEILRDEELESRESGIDQFLRNVLDRAFDWAIIQTAFELCSSILL
jgi:hypothetical protein